MELTQEQKQIGQAFTDEQKSYYNALRNSGDDPVSAFNTVLKVYQPEEAKKQSGVVNFIDSITGVPTLVRSAKAALQSKGVQQQAQAQAQADEQKFQSLKQMLDLARASGDTLTAQRALNQMASLQFGGDIAQNFLDTSPTVQEGIGAAVKAVALPVEAFTGGLAGLAIGGAGVGLGDSIAEGDSLGTTALKTATGAGLGVAGGVILGKAVQAAKPAVSSLASKFANVAKPAIEKVVPSGSQIVKESAGYVGRALKRPVDFVKEAGETSVKASQQPTKGLKRAVEAGIEPSIVENVRTADLATKNTLKEVVNVAGDPLRGSKNALEPIGESASKQFDIIENARKAEGKNYEKVLDKIIKDSGNTKLDGDEFMRYLNKQLEAAGIKIESKASELKWYQDMDTFITKNESLVNDTSLFPANMSREEKQAIARVYEEIRNQQGNLTAKSITQLDQLLSKLRYQSKDGKVLSSSIQTIDGEAKNIYDLFRDSIGVALESIAGKENRAALKEVNTRYGELRRLIDAIKDNIFKDSERFKSLGLNIDISNANFAPNGLRRIFSNATTAPSYGGIVEAMQAKARELGYKGADIVKATDTAIEMLSKYFPEGVQKTSIEGINKGGLGLGDIAGKVVRLGKRNKKELQKIIREMLD